MKIIFFDTETTGLDPKVNGIHQLAGEIMVDGVIVDTFDYRISPFKGCEIDNKALAISKTKHIDFLRYNQEFRVQHMFQVKLLSLLNLSDEKDKFFLAGWRAPEFDVKFLQEFFDRNTKGDFYTYFWSNPIDVKVLATQYLIEQRPQMESFRLEPVAKYLGVEVDETKLHSAAYDAYLSRMVYEILPKCILESTKPILKKKPIQ